MTTAQPVKKNPQVTTPEFRVSYANVFAARKVNESDPNEKAKFSVTMLFPKNADLSKLMLIAQEALIAKWGPDKAKWPANRRNPFRNGAEKDAEGYGPDVIFISASSKNKPGIVDASLNAIMDPAEFYSGCYARATVNAYAYDFKGNRGVAFGLRNIQKLRDGDPLGGKNKPEADFDAIALPSQTDTAADFGMAAPAVTVASVTKLTNPLDL